MADTPATMARKLFTLAESDRLHKARAGVLRGVVKQAHSKAMKTATGRGLGQVLLRQSKKKVGHMLRAWSNSRNDKAGILHAAIEAYGTMASIDQGGRTKPHVIRPRLAKVLAFKQAGGFGFGGDQVFARRVNHPGAPVEQYPFMRDAQSHIQRELPPGLDEAHAKVIAALGLN